MAVKDVEGLRFLLFECISHFTRGFMMSKKWTNKVAHLPQDITIDRVEEHSDSVELFISYPEHERTCPK